MSNTKKPTKPAPQAETTEPLPHAYFVYAERECQNGSVTTFSGVVNASRPILEEGDLMKELRGYVEKRMDEANKGKRGFQPAGNLIVKSLSYLGERPAPPSNQTL